jgi:hypothetical protein
MIRLPSVGAWSNGVDGPDTYGTHDWVLDKAAGALGLPWLDKSVALESTDDPDTEDGLVYASSPWWHVYDEWGKTYGEAPEAAQFWFDKAELEVKDGDFAAASYSVGILAHIVGDIAQPMHTDSRPAETSSVHTGYERAVDSRTELSDSIYSFTYDGATTGKASDVVIELARAAHPYYRPLVRTFSDGGYSPRVHRITQRQLNAASNTLADLLIQLDASVLQPGEPKPSPTRTPLPPPESEDDEEEAEECDDAYPDFCIPPPPPDLDCPDIDETNFTVKEPDPHGFDGNNDGIGCES